MRRDVPPWVLSVMGALPLALLSSVLARKPFWGLGRSAIVVIAAALTGYLVAVFALQRQQQRRGVALTLRQMALPAMAAFIPMLFAAVVLQPRVSRITLLALPVAGMVLLVLSFWPARAARLRTVLIATLAAVAIATQVGLMVGNAGKQELRPVRVQSTIDTSLYEVKLISHRHVIPPPFTQAGGISLFADRYILASGDGELFSFERPAGEQELRLQKLAYRVPMNSQDFATAMQGVPVQLPWFRTIDVLAYEIPGGIRLLASHHYWDKDRACFMVRVSVLEGELAQFSSATPALQWRTAFETTPCLPVTRPGKAPRFGGLEGGGRMAYLSSQQVLLTVGDHAVDGWGMPERAAQEPGYSFGKIVLLNPESGDSRHFTSGHRNPQGLAVGASGAIWSTEHGPQGGDELNLLIEGANYGWPLVTHGVDYGTRAWPLSSVPGSHDGEGFAQPFFSWLPSIGVSALVELDGSRFAFWQGDLIVGSLINRQLWRLRVRNQRVVLAEPIPIGERIRDMVQGHRGELVLWTDRESIMFLEPAPAEPGQGARHLFRACAACHSVPRGQKFALGPSLVGVVGRDVASVRGFEYSSALEAAGGQWTRERLDAFLANPAAVVPGNSMAFAGIADPGTRRKLIDYLASPDSDLTYSPGGGEL